MATINSAHPFCPCIYILFGSLGLGNGGERPEIKGIQDLWGVCLFRYGTCFVVGLVGAHYYCRILPVWITACLFVTPRLHSAGGGTRRHDVPHGLGV